MKNGRLVALVGLIVSIFSAIAFWMSLEVAGASFVLGVVGGSGVWCNREWHKRQKQTVIGRMRLQLAQAMAHIRRVVGRSALKMPWYIVVGPEGAGKSRLLDVSNLLIYAEAVPDAGCETHSRLMATAEGLMVDTPGRLLHPGHHNEWRSLLKSLCLKLGRKRFGGTIVAIDLQDLREIDCLVERLKPALNHVMNISRMRAPLYIVFTQADKLIGFMPTFAEHRNICRQAWGFSLDDTDEVALETGHRMSELMETLRRFSVGQLGLGSDSETRARRYMFPQAFAGVEKPVSQLVEKLFGVRISEETTRLSGVYFMAAPPPELPSDKNEESSNFLPAVSSPMLELPAWATACSQDDPVALVRSHSQGPSGLLRPGPEGNLNFRGYFVEEFFTKVLRHNLGRDTTLWRPGLIGLWHVGRRQCITAAAIAGISLLGLFSYLKNSKVVSASHASIMPLLASPSEVELEEALPNIGRLTSKLLRFRREGAPYSMRFGQASLDRLVEPLGQLTTALTHNLVLAAELEQSDAVFSQGWERYGFVKDAPSDAERSDLLTRLRILLLTTSPKERGEPTLVDDGQAAWLANAWVKATLPPDSDEETQAAVSEYIERQVDLLAALPSLNSLRPPDTVLRIRSLLQRRPLADLMVDGMVHDALHLGPPVDSEILQPGSHAVLTSLKSVPRALTQTGFQNVVAPLLTGGAQAGSAWVLGPLPQSVAARQEQVRHTRERYFSRYVAAWQDFLDGLRWREPQNIWAAQRLLDVLTEGEPKLIPGLLRAVSDQTKLSKSQHPVQYSHVGRGLLARLNRSGIDLQKDPARVTKSRPGKKMQTGSDVAAVFEGLDNFVGANDGKVAPIDQFQDALVSLKTSLTAYLEAPRGSEALLEQLRQTRLLAHNLLEQVPSGSGMRPRIAQLIIVPLDHLTRALARGVRAQSDSAWISSVVNNYRPLARRYPFHPHGLDAPMADIFSFFRPGVGDLWAYYRSELAQDIVPVGRNFSFDERMGGVIRHTYNSQILSYLSHARQATQALFPTGEGSEPDCVFEARLVGAPGVTRVDLDYAGSRLTLSRGEHTGKWQRLHWPPQDLGAQGTRLVAHGERGAEASWRHDGPWALWRLMESGRALIDREVNALTIVWPLGGHASALQLEIRPLRREHPFFDVRSGGGLFETFRHSHLNPPPRLGLLQKDP